MVLLDILLFTLVFTSLELPARVSIIRRSVWGTNSWDFHNFLLWFWKVNSSNYNLFVLPRHSQSRSTARWPPEEKLRQKIRFWFKITFAFNKQFVFCFMIYWWPPPPRQQRRSEPSPLSPLPGLDKNYFWLIQIRLDVFSLKIEISMSVVVYQHLKRAIAEDLGENERRQHGDDGQDHRHAVCGDKEK